MQDIQSPATKPCPYCHVGTAEFRGLDEERPNWLCRDCETSHTAPFPTLIAASTEPMQFLKINKLEADNLNVLCYLVDDWAEKKGWNEPKNEEQILLDHALARRMLRIQLICEEIEHIRKNGAPGATRIDIISDEDAADLASFALMATELAEAAEAVILDKEFDDHVPEIPAEDAELADVLIRIFHFCGKRGIDLGKAVQVKHQYNIGRAYRHGKKA